ncbi:motility associated factor glycosyltransferase family protein [Flocculibacter collagenilyticus]|uniref:motility associated factor glycosyltransferase family protein n=1 Tax=Flocculibacter collagenilyticus TaxID=2744479 RepID=UPI0018F4AE83|nr:6-hydroxymethylpterin diphosphokinase MptE-like protein [Flocculibacter collagenilyticus]
MSNEVNKNILRNILTITFQKNLIFFKDQFPHFYEKFKDYRPEKFGLELDESGALNIGGPTGWVYSEDPKEVSLQQAKDFLEQPVRSLYRLPALTTEQVDEQNPLGFIHMNYLREVAVLGRAHMITSSDGEFEHVGRYPFMSLIGVGLGYHLTELMRVNIDHLYLYEPNEDIFFASMHTFDYESFVSHFQESGGSVTILVNPNVDKYIDGFLKLLHKFGQFKAGILPIYKHYDSEKTDDALGRYFKNLSYVYGGFGFTEDEFISLSHTSQNIKAKRNYIQEGATLKLGDDIPVFICGAGPSLDNDIDFIKENQDKAIVFSCGSSLAALHKAGIVPDYHIEIERTEPVYDWLKLIDDKEYLSKITMVAMQTVFPKAIDVFGDNIIFLKPNDGGTDLLRVTYGDELKIAQIYSTNPTVVNGAYGFSDYIGCGDTYFFGADMGYKDPSKHHSKNTGYYSKFKDLFEDFDTSVTRDANFGEDKVYSNHTFDWARSAIEFRLRNHLREEKQVFNCSDGAKINGAEPLHAEEIVLENVLDKAAIKDELKSMCVENPFDIEKWNESLAIRGAFSVKMFDDLFDKRYMEADFDSNQIIDILSEQHKKLFSYNGTKEIFTLRLLKGSMTYMQTCILGLIYCIKTEQERRIFIKAALKVYMAYMTELKEMFINQFGPFKELPEDAFNIERSTDETKSD